VTLPTSASISVHGTAVRTFTKRTEILFFKTELPGTKKEDIDIKVARGRLVISGETKRSDEVKEEN